MITFKDLLFLGKKSEESWNRSALSFGLTQSQHFEPNCRMLTSEGKPVGCHLPVSLYENVHFFLFEKEIKNILLRRK